MSTTQGPTPKPPLGPILGADEAANLSLLFDPAPAPDPTTAEGHSPDYRESGLAALVPGRWRRRG